MIWLLAPPPSPVSKLARATEKEKQLPDGRGGKWGCRVGESYDNKEAWSSINHSVLSAWGIFNAKGWVAQSHQDGQILPS